MKIFVTGASGFVGGAVATQLAQQHSVVAMARSDSSADQVRLQGLTPVSCSLTDVSSSHLKDCDLVVHSAAYVEAWGTRAQYWDANVEGTRRLLFAARDAGVRRFIHIGTEACLFHGQDMHEIDESYPYALQSPYLYSETKAVAEKLVLEANEPDGLQTISVRPRMVWGPGDQTILPEVLQMIEQGSFVWVNHGRAQTATTHIANLVHGIELAIERGRGGEAYFVTDGAARTIKEFLTDLLATQGVTAPARSVPAAVLKPLAWTIETAWRLCRIRRAPPITRFAADLLSADCTIRLDKAKQELGYVPVISVGDGMQQLAASSS